VKRNIEQLKPVTDRRSARKERRRFVGYHDNGTVFSLSLPPPSLNIVLTGNQAVLFWSASATNYILQSTTNLASPNWVTASDAVPVIAFTVTNTSPARFFRLQ